jgi:hypothetical protein
MKNSRFLPCHAAPGMYLPPSAFESWFLNNALTIADLDETIRAAAESLKEFSAAKQQLTGFETGVFLECGGEMGDRGIAQHDGDFGDAEPFFIEEIAGMFHSLALVEIENGGAEHFFESLLSDSTR